MGAAAYAFKFVFVGKNAKHSTSHVHYFLTYKTMS